MKLRMEPMKSKSFASQAQHDRARDTAIAKHLVAGFREVSRDEWLNAGK